MSEADRTIEAARAARDAARSDFDAQLRQVRGDPETESIGGRIANRLGDDARSALDQAIDVAGESKGIIAGTIAALALWFLRHPIIDWIERQLAGEPSADNESDEENHDERD